MNLVAAAENLNALESTSRPPSADRADGADRDDDAGLPVPALLDLQVPVDDMAAFLQELLQVAEGEDEHMLFPEDDDFFFDLPEPEPAIHFWQHYPLGTRVEKLYPCPDDDDFWMLYSGTVIGYDAEYGYYGVLFEDDDFAEFDEDELAEMICD
jgi:hypothetical protein